MPNIGLPQRNPAVWQTLELDGKPLPGVIQKARIGGNLLMQQEQISGQNGTLLANAQWSEDSATFVLKVSTEAEIKRLGEFRTAYKNRPGQNPRVVSVRHPVLQLFGVYQMIVSGIELEYEPETWKNIIVATITLTNITPKVEKKKTDGTSSAKPAIKPGDAASFDDYNASFDITEPPPAKPSATPPPVKP
jgi:hypothetical protein